MQSAKKARGLARVARHEKLFAWPLFVASLIWFGSLTAAWVDQHPSPAVRAWCSYLLFATWMWFFIDYLVRLVIAGKDRGTFVRTRIFDLLTITVPFLRPFMILTFVWRLPAFLRGTPGRLRVRYVVMTVLFSFLLVYVNSYLVWAAEKGHKGAQIVDFGDALWWGFTTITTVGYGDLVPVTALGRGFALFLMVGGVFVVGVVTATVVSAISDQLKEFAVFRASEAVDSNTDSASPDRPASSGSVPERGA